MFCSILIISNTQAAAAFYSMAKTTIILLIYMHVPGFPTHASFIIFHTPFPLYFCRLPPQPVSPHLLLLLHRRRNGNLGPLSPSPPPLPASGRGGSSQLSRGRRGIPGGILPPLCRRGGRGGCGCGRFLPMGAAGRCLKHEKTQTEPMLVVQLISFRLLTICTLLSTHCFPNIFQKPYLFFFQECPPLSFLPPWPLLPSRPRRNSSSNSSSSNNNNNNRTHLRPLRTRQFPQQPNEKSKSYFLVH